MIRHVALLRWNPDVTDAHIAAAGAALDGLPEVIASIDGYAHGRDIGVNQGNFDYAIVATFADLDGYLAYRDHPAHQAFLSAFVKGSVAERTAVQFEA